MKSNESPSVWLSAEERERLERPIGESWGLPGRKGTVRHRAMGWVWMVLMAGVTLSSLAIRQLNDGRLSWIHGLTLWTLFSMAVAVFALRRGKVRLHAGFMIGAMVGVIIAGLFALAPGRFISEVAGY